MNFISTLFKYLLSLVYVCISTLTNIYNNFCKTNCASCQKYIGNFGFYITDMVCEDCSAKFLPNKEKLENNAENNNKNTMIMDMIMDELDNNIKKPDFIDKMNRVVCKQAYDKVVGQIKQTTAPVTTTVDTTAVDTTATTLVDQINNDDNVGKLTMDNNIKDKTFKETFNNKLLKFLGENSTNKSSENPIYEKYICEENLSRNNNNVATRRKSVRKRNPSSRYPENEYITY